MHQGPGDGQALQLPAAECLRQARAQTVQTHSLQHGLHALRIGRAQKQQGQAHVLGHI